MKRTILISIAIIILSYVNLSCQKNNEYKKYFDVVWNTINDKFYDANFEGKDWKAMKKEYEPLIVSANSDSAFYDQINRMLFELGISHTGVIPPGYWAIVEPTTFATGSTGIDIRFINNKAVITSVKTNSPADSAGIKPSYILLEIEGKSIEQISKERINFLEPPFNKTHSITSEVQSYLYGDENSKIELKYLDNMGVYHSALIILMKREKFIPAGGGFPATIIEFKADLIDTNIAYIHFNWFYPGINNDFFKILHKFKNVKGLIIDLRGNPGGERNEAIKIAELFIKERTFAYIEKSRNAENKVFLEPVQEPFSGDLVILVDIMSKSSSEWLAGCLQSISRATIIGEQTPGSVGPADFVILPNGSAFLYPAYKTILNNGKVLEGVGVIPDIIIDIDVNSLLINRDLPLERAIFLLNNN